MTGPAYDNFSQAELDKFNELAHRWWDPQGPQKALHALNPARLGYVADRIELRGACHQPKSTAVQSLAQARSFGPTSRSGSKRPGTSVNCNSCEAPISDV